MKKYLFTTLVAVFFAIGFTASDGESYDSDFTALENLMPEDGSSVCDVYDAKPYGDRLRTLQKITFFEKNGECDIRLEGLELDGSKFTSNGFWNKGTITSTFEAVEYKYSRLGNRDNVFLIDKDLNIYSCNTSFESDEDIARAFKNGPIGKLRKSKGE